MIRTASVIGSVSRRAGGLFSSVRRLVQSLREIGLEVKVVGLRDEFSDADILAWLPVQVTAFKPSWPVNFGYAPGLFQELIEFEPHVVHTHGLWLYPGVAANRYSRKMRRPYIISPHGMLDPWAVENSQWKKIIGRFLFEGRNLHGARCLRALCESEARSIRQFRLNNDIAIIPNGIDLPESGKLKSENGNPPWSGVIEPGRKVLLYLGRIHPKKGIPNLLKAWAQIQKTEGRGHMAEWVLAIAGWDQGGHEDEMKNLAGELGLAWTDVRDQKSDNGGESRKQKTESKNEFHHSTFRNLAFSLLFLGPQFNEAKAACYHFCDAFILPSFSEGLPMAVLEAWANSKPVVMTPQCNLPQGFSAGAALVINPNTESIAEGLNEFLRMTETERVAMGSRGRALAADQFSWPRIAAQMQEAYEWMLGDGPRPACMADF